MHIVYRALVLLCLLDVGDGSPVLQKPLKVGDKPTRALTIQVPVDHINDTDSRTFPNRYWANTTFHQDGGPIFLYDAGERGVTDQQAASQFSDAHSVMLLARRFNGTAIAWEHRFFGESLPLPLTIESTQREKKDALQYLGTEQALEDVVYFAKHFKPLGFVTRTASPWIWIGGSYPGQRAAMIRKRNPDVFWASWSSSAPVEDSLVFPEYYQHISRDLPTVCRSIIQQVIRHIDDILANGTTLMQYRLRWEIARRFSSGQSAWEKFMFTTSAPNSVIALHLRDVVSGDWQWYGMKGGMNTTCATVERGAISGDIESALGAVLDATEANSHRQRQQPSFSRMDSMVWQYQVCTEYPYFRISGAASHPYNILSTYLTEEVEWENCLRQFPWLYQLPNITVPLTYTGWDTNVSNTMWTTGLRDPWHGLSMAPVRSLVSGAPKGRNMTQKVPACEAAFDGQNLFGLVFEEGRHCTDLNSGTKEGIEAVKLFGEALELWLPGFYNRSLEAS